MASFLPDTSCMIAAVCSWHEHHERACREIENRLESKQRMVIAGPALIEAYAVLTRLPAPHRIAASEAMNLLEANFIRGTQIVSLEAPAYGGLLMAASTGGVSGGRIYDAVIAACARKARVDVLFTFNEKHFASFNDEVFEVVVP